MASRHVTRSGAVVEYSFDAGRAFESNSFAARIIRPDGRTNVVWFGCNRRPTEGTPELVEDLTRNTPNWNEVVCDV